jgi:hypothetical protein
LQDLREVLSKEIRRVHLSAGISDEEIEAAERSYHAARCALGDDYWQHQILQTKPTEDLDAQTQSGLEHLLQSVKPEWLRDQAQQPYRLDSSFLTSPLHVVNGVRVGTAPQNEGTQRFARMLLLAKDHLEKEWNLDFFSAASFVPEIAVLGNSLKEIAALGPQADRKLAELPTLPNKMVTSTIYELLVGAACIRRGLDARMVQENRSRKVPDYRIDGIGVPAAIECKRRLGLTEYELQEAKLIENLYQGVRGLLQERGHHLSIEASFRLPLGSVSIAEFSRDVLATAEHADDGPLPTTWGSLRVQSLPFRGHLEGTRLYSPDFLQQVFEWVPEQTEWDGLLCEIDPPLEIAVERFMRPLCLKWRSESEEAQIKKVRGVASLWADAVKQIPDGELGFIYIAYPEGARAQIADARTRYIIDYMKECWHRWSVRIPATVISRIYARPVGGGCPDLIESSLPGVQDGQEFWLSELPCTVFTRQFE